MASPKKMVLLWEMECHWALSMSDIPSFVFVCEEGESVIYFGMFVHYLCAGDVRVY